MLREVRLDLAVGLDDGAHDVGPRLGAQVPGSGGHERLDVELVRRDEQPHERHLVVGLVGDVGQDDEPRPGHVRVDRGSRAARTPPGRRPAARPAVARPAGGPPLPPRTRPPPSSAPARTVSASTPFLPPAIKPCLTSAAAAGRLRPLPHENQGEHKYAGRRRQSACSSGPGASGAPACAWCTRRAWAIRAAICRARTSSPCSFSTSCGCDPESPRDPDRDRFVLSKGHASAALYAALAERGFFPPQDLDSYMRPLSQLNGHPDRNKVPGVEANTGPLGHGLPIAVGMAVAAKLDGAAWRTFVLTGDGELQEGSNWEAIMAAAHLRPRQPDGHRRSQPAAAGRCHREDGGARTARRTLARVRLGRDRGGRP